jgi:hypothetical protein
MAFAARLASLDESNMSFVSITFDKCRYRLPKFDAAVSGLRLVPWFRDTNLRV